MAGNVTLKDIARKTNLSVGAVSKALAGYPQVSQATRKRVLAASDLLNYQPKVRQPGRQTGRANLRAGKHSEERRINLILTEHWGARSAQWMPALAKAGQRVGLRLEISYVELGKVISGDLPDQATASARARSTAGNETQAVESWEQAIISQTQNVEGLLLFGCLDQPHLQALAGLSVPAVVIGDMAMPRTGQGLPVHLVSTDKVAMGQLAATTLINHGHKRIGFFCGLHPAGGWNHQWHAGYRLAMMHAGLPVDNTLQYTSDLLDPMQISQAAVAHFDSLKQPPTAYITPSIDVASCFTKIKAQNKSPLKAGQLVIGGHIDDARAHGLQHHLLLDEPVENMAIHALDLLARLIDDESLPCAEISVPFATHHLQD